jgi:hypothetical protein
MKIAEQMVKIASELEKRGLRKVADELDTLLDEILAMDKSTDLHGQEPEAVGGSGPLPPSSMAADDGMLAAAPMASEVAPVEPVAPPKPALTPEQEKDRLVKRIARKVMATCEEQQFFKDIPRMLRETQMKKLSPAELHSTFKLQAKRLIQCAAELMNRLLERNHVELSEHEKFGLIRKLGLEALDRCGCGTFKYDFVSAMAEYKSEGHTLS